MEAEKAGEPAKPEAPMQSLGWATDVNKSGLLSLN